MSSADPDVVRTVLDRVLGFESSLRDILQRARVTLDSLEQAQQQAAPHRVGISDVAVHEACQGRGCVACAGSGVAHAASGRPFQAPPSHASSSAAVGRSEKESEAAKAALRELVRLWRETARALSRAERTARELERIFSQFIR